MFRDDRNAMVHRLDALQREADSLRGENSAMREALLARTRQESLARLASRNIYQTDVAELAPGERAALTSHKLSQFPAWLVGLLTPLTLGLFPLIHFGLMHDKLPRAQEKDPTSGKAIGFSFIPYYNLYWMLFNSLRLADRIDLQFRLRGMAARAPRGMLLACSILTIPALLHPFFLLYLIFSPALLLLWALAGALLQLSVNRLVDVAALDGHDPYATPPPGLMGGDDLPRLP